MELIMYTMKRAWVSLTLEMIMVTAGWIRLLPREEFIHCRFCTKSTNSGGASSDEARAGPMIINLTGLSDINIFHHHFKIP